MVRMSELGVCDLVKAVADFLVELLQGVHFVNVDCTLTLYELRKRAGDFALLSSINKHSALIELKTVAPLNCTYQFYSSGQKLRPSNVSGVVWQRRRGERGAYSACPLLAWCT